jgi:hypothetical protein
MQSPAALLLLLLLLVLVLALEFGSARATGSM